MTIYIEVERYPGLCYMARVSGMHTVIAHSVEDGPIDVLTWVSDSIESITSAPEYLKAKRYMESRGFELSLRHVIK